MVSILNKQIYVATQLFTRYLNIHLFTRWHVANKKTIVSKVKIHKFTTSKPKPNNIYVVVTIPSVIVYTEKTLGVLCCVCCWANLYFRLQISMLIVFNCTIIYRSIVNRDARCLCSSFFFLIAYLVIPGRSYVHTNNKFNDFETKNGESSSSTL